MSHMNHFAVKWYEDQQQKKKDSYEKGQISIINRQLQTIVHQVHGKIEAEKYQKQIDHVNRHLVSSHVWNIGYLNNLESKKVALEQAVFLSLILHAEEEIKSLVYLLQEVERYMHQLGNFDWGMYGEFNKRHQAIKRTLKSERFNGEITKVF